MEKTLNALGINMEANVDQIIYTFTKKQFQLFIFFIVSGLLFLNFCIYMGLKECGYFDVVVEKIVERTVEKVNNTIAIPKSWRKLVEEIAPKYSLPTELVELIIQIESSEMVDAVRYEPGILGNVKKQIQGKHLSDDQAKLLASSHGLMQVLGINAYTQDIPWSKLYDPEVNINEGCRILKNCFVYWNKFLNEPAKHTIKALECYNGSAVYPPRVLAGLQDLLLKRFYQQLANNLKSGNEKQVDNIQPNILLNEINTESTSVETTKEVQTKETANKAKENKIKTFKK